jgi:hypothetical protein
MTESKASRTLLKSPPELWSEVSTATSLQRHMDQFGEIRITKLEPETAVAWEGEHARGTITLEVSGWGTKVSLTAEPVAVDAVDGTESEDAGQGVDGTESEDAEPEAGAQVEPEAGAEAGPEPAESVGPPNAVEPEPMSPHRDQLDAPQQRPRWTRRLARAFKKWLSAEPLPDADPAAPAPEPEPEHQVAWPAVAPEPEQPATSQSPIIPPEPAPAPEPQPQLEPASTAALDAALNSLGQAHHRPFSRA